MKFPKSTIHFLAALIILGGGTATAAFAQTYVAPSSLFTGSVAPALNAAQTDQQKIGSLGIGSTASPQKLCLNATNSADASHCITSWSSLANQFGGPFVSLSRTPMAFDLASVNCGPSTPSNLCAGDYTLQSGFIHLKASSTTTPQQAFTTIVQDPNLQMCSYDRSGDQSPGFCNYGPNQGAFCYTNNDCGFVSTAVYSSDGGSSTNAAGYLSGVTYVTAPTNDPGLGLHGRICLNGTVESAVSDPPGGVCIQSWNEISSGTGNVYVKRQVGNPPPSQQTLGAAISGVINLATAITGSTAGLPMSYTCGDSLCSANTIPPETAASCPIDCSGVASPSFSASFVGAVAYFNLTTKPQTPSGNVNVLIVRTSAATSTFIPVNGIKYTMGQVIGNSTVVYVGSIAQNTTINPQPTDTIPSTGFFSYRAFQANSFPVYGAPADFSVGQIVKLTVTYSPNKGSFYDSLGGINCFTPGGPGCTALYQINSDDTVIADIIQSGYSIGSWNGCDSFPAYGQCQLVMTGDRTVHASFNTDSGGGGGGGPPILVQ